MLIIKPGHGISLDLPPECQHIASLGTEFDVMNIHKAFDPTRLVRAPKVTRELSAKLLTRPQQ
jgi:hypothetical protein